MTAAAILVEAWAGVEEARRLGLRAASWWTENPYVAERLSAEGEPVHWLSDLCDSGDTAAIGRVATRCGDAVDAWAASLPLCAQWPDLAALAGRDTFVLLNALGIKQMHLERWLAGLGEHPAIVMGNAAEIAKTTAPIHRFDNLYAALAAGREGVRVMPVPSPDFRQLEAEIERSTWSHRLLSFLNLSPSQVFRRFLKLFGLTSFGLPWAKRTLVVLRPNDFIGEFLWPAFARGWRISLAGQGAKPPQATATPDPQAVADVERLITKQWRHAFPHWGALPAAQRAALTVARLLAAAPGALAAARAHVQARARHWPGGVAVSNTPGGSLAAAAFMAALVERGIPVAVVEHGVSAGLSVRHRFFRACSEARHGSAYLVCSNAASAFFRVARSLATKAIPAVGLAEQTRTTPSPRLQRQVIRAAMGLRGRYTVMYVALPLQNNMLIGPFTPSDKEIWDSTRALVVDVLPQVPGDKVCKLYPTRRFWDPHPLRGLVPAPGIQVVQEGDFRFMRSAADVIILDSPLSTLGWALGAGKPVIYIAMAGFPLYPRVRRAMEKALLVVHTDQPGWQQNLVELLRDRKRLEREWREREADRRAFLAEYVFGPEHPVERVLDFLDTHRI